MEAKKLKRHDTHYFKQQSQHNNFINTHKSPSLIRRHKLTIKSAQNPETISLESLKAKIVNKSLSPIPYKNYTKLPKLDQKLVDISQKSLKNAPARYFIPQYKENVRSNKIEFPDFDLKLLKEINFKLEKEVFEEDQKILHFGLSCRHEFDQENRSEGVKRVKRVRFQLV